MSALGDARTVVNVGAGTGSYEPPDRVVLAVEPSEQMIKQRPARLPIEDLEPGLERLRQDLDSGAWQTRHQDLLTLNAIDAGLRLIVREGP
jgi:hypothetical protein